MKLVSIFRGVFCINTSNIIIHNPEYLFILLLIPLFLIIRYFFNIRTEATLGYSNVGFVRNIPSSSSSFIPHFLFALLLLSLALLIVAFSRPQIVHHQVYYSQGRDIMLILDISDSMLLVDEKGEGYEERDRWQNTYWITQEPLNSRLDLAKEVVAEFIKNRQADRLGLIVFKDYPLTLCPLTFSHDFVLNKLEGVTTNTIMDEGFTAIGEAIVSAINALDIYSEAESKVAILLTDGKNNVPPNPIQWAEVAAEKDIKIYTVGITGGDRLYYFKEKRSLGYIYLIGSNENTIDINTLQEIADITEGKFYLSSNSDELEEIYEEIDRLEQTELKVTSTQAEYEEIFYIFLILSLCLLTFYYILKSTVLKTIP